MKQLDFIECGAKVEELEKLIDFLTLERDHLVKKMNIYIAETERERANGRVQG